MPLTFGCSMPSRGPMSSPEALRASAQRAGDLGFDSIWVSDHIILPRHVESFYPYSPDGVAGFVPDEPYYEPLATLNFLAGCTKRVRLGTHVLIIPYRNPVLTAKILATLDVLTGGRVIAGIGPGSQDREYEIVGLDYKERWPRFDEAAKALRSLLHPNSTPFKGTYYSTEGITLGPHPSQQPSIPIWIGSWGSDVGLRRVARLADGWLGTALDSTPDRFKQAKKRLDTYLQREGKDPTDFPCAVSTMALYVSENQADLERVPSGPGHSHHADETPHERTMVGPPSECIREGTPVER